MQPTGRRVVMFVSVLFLITLSGCTNWRERYETLAVTHKNLEGRYDLCQKNLKNSADRIAQDSQTIEELNRQIMDMDQSPAEATGFGPEYDVSFDPTAGTITVTLDNTILFAAGKASLKSDTSAPLDHILSVLQSKYSGKDVEVVGHTDSDPIKKSKWQDNWELSVQRSLAVTRYLIEKGIPKDKIRAAGCGESRPVASNASAAGKAQNRRVEIVVYVR